MEERTFGGGGSAGIYRGAKFSLFEGGIRVPAMISWPAKIPRNQVRDQMAVNVDWFPTILELCEISSDEEDIEGKSLTGVIYQNAKSTHTSFCWYSRLNRWAVRKGDWKLLKNPIDLPSRELLNESDSIFLVNLKDHPDERVNMAVDNEDVVAELKHIYMDWFEDVTKGK